jgi:hypothetical protein
MMKSTMNDGIARLNFFFLTWRVTWRELVYVA